MYDSSLEERVRLEWRRDQWISASSVLSRIKQDEQKWLGVAFLVFGAIMGIFLLGAFGDELKYLLAWQRRLVFLIGYLIIWILGFVWIAQSLTLREQYYRTKVRLFRAAHELGEQPPTLWGMKEASLPQQGAPGGEMSMRSLVVRGFIDPRRVWNNALPVLQGVGVSEAVADAEVNAVENWYTKATAPLASKMAEILTVMLLMVATVALGALRLDPAVGRTPQDLEVETVPSAGSERTSRIVISASVPNALELDDASRSELGEDLIEGAARERLAQQVTSVDRVIGYIVLPLVIIVLLPFVIYPAWDRWHLARVWCQDVVPLQRHCAAPESTAASD